MLGSSLADVFRTPDYDCRVVDTNQRPEFAGDAASFGSKRNGEGAGVPTR
jgi:hypothetical protein